MSQSKASKKANTLKIILAIGALVYILSPLDLIPDFLPLTGWLDDAFIAGVILYFLRRGVFPAFLSWLNQFASGQNRSQTRSTFEGGSRFQETRRDPYEILGLKPGADQAEIRAAYRRAAQAYHPDKVSHLGPELQALAKKKFLEIQKAYEALSGRHG